MQPLGSVDEDTNYHCSFVNSTFILPARRRARQRVVKLVTALLQKLSLHFKWPHHYGS